MKKIITKNEKETLDFAKNFVKTLKGGEIIGLSGNLGAGKTIFAKGIAQGLNIKDNINSPTFVLMKVYNTPGKIIKKLVHIDAYRLKNPEDLKAIGALDYMQREDTLMLIEWIENIETIIPKKVQGELQSKREYPGVKKISLKNIAENEREIIIYN